MGFNYGYEKKKFDSRWKRLEVEYCDAGMSEEQIAAMKEYDWAWFCSQRVFQNHTQPIPCEQYDEVCGQSQLFRKFASLSYQFIFWNSCMGIHWTLRFSMMRCGPLLTNAGQNDILQKLPKFLRKWRTARLCRNFGNRTAKNFPMRQIWSGTSSWGRCAVYTLSVKRNRAYEEARPLL